MLTVVGEVMKSLSWLDYGLIAIAGWWVYDHGGGTVMTTVKGWFTAGKAEASAIVTRVEALEVQVFGASKTPVPVVAVKVPAPAPVAPKPAA